MPCYRKSQKIRPRKTYGNCFCGKAILKRRSFTCSLSCRNIRIRMFARRGADSHLWKGKKLPQCLDCGKELSSPHSIRCVSCNGISKRKSADENNYSRRKFKRYYQNKILERDNYTCQICFKRGGNLQVDHIQPWAEYVELRFSLDNCRTLCMGCHYMITFGKSKPETVKTWGHNFKNVMREEF